MTTSKPPRTSATSTAPATSAASDDPSSRNDAPHDVVDAVVLDAVPLDPPFTDFATVSRNMHIIGRSVIDPLCKRYELNELSLFALMHLTQEPNQLPSHLSGVLHAKRTNIASTLRTLEYKGLVTIGAGEEDKRQRLINLTDKGRETVAAVEEEMEEARAALVERVDPDKLERITEGWNDFRNIVADMADSLGSPDPSR